MQEGLLFEIVEEVEMSSKKRSKHTRRRSKKFQWRAGYYFILTGMIFLLYVFLFGNHGLIRYYQLQQRKKALVHKIEQLKQEQKALKEEINLLTSNYLYIEKIAREQYQMGKKKEKIYLMVPAGQKKK